MQPHILVGLVLVVVFDKVVSKVLFSFLSLLMTNNLPEVV